MKRVLFVLLAAVILTPLVVVGIQRMHDPGSEEASMPPSNVSEQVSHGAYLVRAGNCMSCHTARGGELYAGGRAIPTPFGSIYSSNLTPDAETGLGKWTADDFWRAIHNGKSKDGSFLYPAFPYPNYTRVTRADSDAMYAYLQTLPSVKSASKGNDLRFPYNQRFLLAFWRALYFSPERYLPQPDRGQEWNRGAYLVQGLGHCSACHTSRNALGGSIAEKGLGGGIIPMLNWYASALTSDPKTGLGDWQVDEIADILQTGVSHRGAVFGPMADVVADSLQHLSAQDIRAMAVYLKSVPKSANEPNDTSVRFSGDAETVLRLGKKVYEQHCATCHGDDGKGAPPAYPPLAGNRSLVAQGAVNPIRIVLNGGYPPSTNGNPRPFGMPPFSPALSDDEVAAVVSYVRANWGNKGALVSPVDVSRLRGAPLE